MRKTRKPAGDLFEEVKILGSQNDKQDPAGDGGRSCTTNEAAELLGISLQTVQRWMDRGHLRGWRTPGGHRRVEIASVHDLLATARQAEGGTASVNGKADAAPRIYLVDDAPADLELLQAITQFVMPKARLISLANGFDALMAIGREPPDLLITDIAMPGFDGIEMIRSMRENAATAHVPIIAVSSHHDEEIRRLFGAIPEGVAFLRKPVAPDTLRSAIARVRQVESLSTQ
jgi:excisionase family DNA binding protein